ncbi:hypothetical protein DENIS_3491 [Desulfonema ishimotonii]|uniref:Uncharacterized protein n=1 Tax=Desulfonema ishimotonii TaxID=45657 RepID=A0A401FZW2_9BACT|nr:Mu transposase C-terminal domain-containing protein [Desulfonema ishimotonii]GBC62519.1 hypothetical protein DENIS_3491 [Desulfonema ishimotonii]
MKEWFSVKEVSAFEKVVVTTIRRRVARGEYIKVREVKSDKGGRGGKLWEIHISSLSPEIQKSLIKQSGDLTPELLPVLPELAPEAQLEARGRLCNLPIPSDLAAAAVPVEKVWNEQTTASDAAFRDPRVRRIARIVQEARCIPDGWKKKAWVTQVAAKNDASVATVYRWLKKYDTAGLDGLRHTKSCRGRAKKWDTPALDFWIGINLKREHRKIAKDALYEILRTEAARNGWRIGGYQSALGWLKKRITPQLLAYRDGGHRALDNMLPAVLRTYADLAPFEILVGDQHRFDFWVVSDWTGEVFRPEGYFWQDLRTRCLYGGAVAQKYSAYLIGLALRMGCNVFGAFKSIYTDNGKPELSRYVTAILMNLRALHMDTLREESNAGVDPDADPEEIGALAIEPGTRRKAIVKNAKAKMIEGTFNIFEGILRDHFRVPGSTKRLTDKSETQDVDQEYIRRLARAGKLLKFSEFMATMYHAMDYYNQEKHHRGLHREWCWLPRPAKTTPWECLRHCMEDGWRPTHLCPTDIDMLFLARADRGGRIVHQGRISFRHGPIYFYEHEALMDYEGQRVAIRYDMMNPGWLLCFDQKSGDFICRAEPIEWSSMLDTDLAGRKIAEKRKLRKEIIAKFRDYTLTVPDFMNYSEITAAEGPEVLPAENKGRADVRARNIETSKTPDEVADDVAEITARMAETQALSQEEQARHQQEVADRMEWIKAEEDALPDEPVSAEPAAPDGAEVIQITPRPLFNSAADRYEWCFNEVDAGREISEADRIWMAEQEAKFTPDEIEYWKYRRANRRAK